MFVHKYCGTEKLFSIFDSLESYILSKLTEDQTEIYYFTDCFASTDRCIAVPVELRSIVGLYAGFSLGRHAVSETDKSGNDYGAKQPNTLVFSVDSCNGQKALLTKLKLLIAAQGFKTENLDQLLCCN